MTWLPQPAAWASYALDAQRGVAGSTYETYRAALRLRRESDLGSGGMEWLHGLGDDVIAFVNRDVLVVANLGADAVALPGGAEVLLASIDPDGRRRTAPCWCRRTPPSGRATPPDLHEDGPAALLGGAVRASGACGDVPGLGRSRRDRTRPRSSRPRPSTPRSPLPSHSTSQ